jgi:peptide/nickel transport system substrate-binding protein
LSYANLIGNKDERGNAQWEDAVAMQLLARLTSQTAVAERRLTMELLHRRMVEQVPIIGLYNGHHADAMRADVHDVMSWAAGTLGFWGASRGEIAATAKRAGN